MRNIWVALVLLILVCVMGCGEYGGGYKSPQDAPNRYKVVYDTGRLTDLKLGYLSTEGNIYLESKVIFDSNVVFDKIPLIKTKSLTPVIIGDNYTLYRLVGGVYYVLEKDQ